MGRPLSPSELRAINAGPTKETPSAEVSPAPGRGRTLDLGLTMSADQAAARDSRKARAKVTGEQLAGQATGETRRRVTPLSGIEPETKGQPLDEPDALIGQTPLGQYRILQKIGEGGFGAVYAAEQLGVNRKAVIKVLHRKLVDSDVFVKRFEREASVLAALDNQHLVRLYNFGELEDGQLFLAMEHGGDTTLGDEIRKRGRFEADRALLIAEQIADALEEAHSHGIIHRDLKPPNVLLSRKNTSDWVKVVDVGIAKILDASEPGERAVSQLTATGVVIGTPAYFSPEQARGLSLDGRSDLYSLGILLYEMLTGKLPINGVSAMDFVRAHAVDAPTPLSEHGVALPSYIETIVYRALEKSPAKRFQSAHEMRQALAKARERMFAGSRGGRKRVVLLSAVAAIAVVAGGLKAWHLTRPARLIVAVSPDSAEIFLDDRRIRPGTLEVAPGPHTIHAKAIGHKPATYSLKVEPNEVLPVKIELVEEAATPPIAPKTPAAGPPLPPPRSVKPPSAPKPQDPPPAAPDNKPALKPPPPVAAPAIPQEWVDRMTRATKTYENRQYGAAIKQLEDMLILSPPHESLGPIYQTLGNAHYQNGESNDTLKYFELYRPYCPPSDTKALGERIDKLREELGLPPAHQRRD